MTKSPTDPSPAAPVLPAANGSLHPALSGTQSSANGHAPRALPSKAARRRPRWVSLLVATAALLLLGGGIFAVVSNRAPAARADVLLHAVKRGPLAVSVTEKGQLESASNMDLTCKVRAGTKGFATSINWVIDDGSKVKKDQLLMVLDDSALQDQYRDEKIKVDTAYAAKVQAEKQYEITVKANEQAIAKAQNDLDNAKIDLEKLVGLTFESARAPVAAVVSVPAALTEGGDYKRQVDDLTGKVRLEESNVEQGLERSAWADRMVKQKYMSAAQAQAERSKLDSSRENLRALRNQLVLLVAYDRKKQLSTFTSAVDNFQRALDQARLQAEAGQIQADIDRKTKTSIYNQELEKLKDIEDQIRECKIHAPQDGMVVYFKNESARFSSNPTNLIEQGAQVKEGQKLLRIPNLDRMQVNTKVHEAMVSRIRGDVRIATNLVEKMQVAMLANPDPFSRLLTQNEDLIQDVRNKFKQQEYRTASKGQPATIRVDAMPDVKFPGRVRSVAAVASQADSWMSDIKLFPTLVLIEQQVDGLKPDMTAEVTIHINDIKDVLAVPLQAIVGGTELGAKRKVFVRTPTGYEEREVTLGLYNEREVEVREGLREGDEVVLNPKVLLGDNKAKTREAGGDGSPNSKGDGTGNPKGEGKKGDGKKKKGGPGAGGPGGPVN